MNIFLDSNILYQDYFFDNKSPKNILEYAKDGLIHLHMSEIVKLELRWQFQREIEEKNRVLSKVIKDANRLKLDCDIEIINIDSQLEKFDEFYLGLEQLENFTIVPVKNEYLPDIVDRAIYRKKPFTAEKTELKDALIWKSYADFVETNNSENCILLTNNTSDFCTKKDKSKVHQDLLPDTDRFTVINTSFEFIRNKSSILESPEHKFQVYISKFNFNEDEIFNLILEKFDTIIIKKAHRKVENMSPNDIVRGEFWIDGYVVCDDVDIIDCLDIEHEILSDRALVSGKINISCETECFNYNPVRDSGDDEFSFVSDQSLFFEIYFNFDLEEDKYCSEFEITDMKLVEIN